MKHAIGISLIHMLLWGPAAISAASHPMPPPAARIVGGEPAPEGAWPWMAAIVHAGESSETGRFCGGSLIAERWIMTAAHCVTGYQAADLEIIVGTHDLQAPVAERHAVEDIVIHPDFRRAAEFDSDLALLELRSAVDLPTLALADDWLMSQLPPGTLLTVTGWGNRSSTGEDYSPLLHQVDVPLVAHEVCEAAYAGTATPLIPGMVCAGYEAGGMDSCQGDSGGPLMANITGNWQQVGIVSFGRGCALPASYGVHTRVADFTNWVLTRIGGLAVPYEHDFGPLPLSRPEAISLRVENRHDSAAVALSDTRIAGRDPGFFDVASDECSGQTLLPGTACEITVTAEGTEPGAREASLVVDGINGDLNISHEITSRLRATILSAVSFESALDNPSLSWFSGGDASWLIQTGASAMGGAAAASGAIGHGETSIAMTEVDGPGLLSFRWKVSSEAGFDFLELRIDNRLEASISGEVDWSPGQLVLPEGAHTIAWAYVKDGAVAAGTDSGSLDQVAFERTVGSSDDGAEPDTGPSGGGGSAGWPFLAAFCLGRARRQISRRAALRKKEGQRRFSEPCGSAQ